MFRPRKYSRYTQSQLHGLEEMKSRKADSSWPHSVNNNDEEIKQLRIQMDRLLLTQRGYMSVVWNGSVCRPLQHSFIRATASLKENNELKVMNSEHQKE
jgi:hypothetical protein